MEILLLIGLGLLFHSHRKLTTRVEQLEGLLIARGEAPPLEAEARKPTARVIWSTKEPEPAVPQAEAPPQPDAAQAEAAPQADAAEAPAMRDTLANLFENFVGGRLLIWVGGIALAIAGVFLVRYSIEIGLITPAMRMAMAGFFGFALLGAGELVRRRTGPSGDRRAAQALVGASIFVLYATVYGSLILYQLIGAGVAGLLMALITIGALALSLRHGAPTAAMGLAGGFATPLLVGDPEAGAMPLLFYLGLLNVAIWALARRREWTWLAAAAAVLSFVWTGMLLAGSPGDALAAGLFIVALGIAASLVRAGEGWQVDFLRPAAIGLVQLAVLVARVDVGPAAWGLFGILAIASLFLSTRRAEYRFLPAFALALALALLGVKAYAGSDPLVPWAGAGITLIFGGFAGYAALRRGTLLATATASAAFAAPVIILRLAMPDLLDRPAWGLMMIAAAIGPAILGWRRSAGKAERMDPPLLAAGAAALLLLGIAGADLLPRDLLASYWLLLALGVSFAARSLADRGLALLALAAGAAALAWTAWLLPDLWTTLGRAALGDPALASTLPGPALALKSLLLPAPLLFLLWRTLPEGESLREAAFVSACAVAGLAFYLLWKQVFALESVSDFVARGFAERTILTQLLFAGGWLLTTRRQRIGMALTAIAAARLFWFDMLVHNPALQAQAVGALPVFNLLLPAYLLSAVWLHAARRRAGSDARSSVWLALFLAALLLGVALLVRQLFQGAILSGPGIPDAESYTYSLAGLLLSIGLLLAGIRLPDKALRLAGLALLTLTIGKAFISDASALGGLLRILSFLGLGIVGIAIGALYPRILRTDSGKPGASPPAS